MSNHQKFLREFDIFDNSAVGVVAVRTREPFRAIEAVREYALAHKREFRSWTMTVGWATFDQHNPAKAPQVDGTVQPLQALYAVNNVGGGGAPPASAAAQPARPRSTDDKGFPTKGVYAMMWPHFILAPGNTLPPFVQCLAEYAAEFAGNAKRLLMIVPNDFVMPKELEDSVPVLDYDTPSMGELADSYNVVAHSILENKRPDFADHDKDRLFKAGIGMTAQEFESALSRAFVENMGELPNVPADTIVALISKIKTEVLRRSEVLELMPVGNMSDIGGLDALKDWVQDRKEAFNDDAKEAGVDRPKGIALVGPPGCGKTAAGKAIAHSLGLPLIQFNISRVFAGLVGASETKTRTALKMVRALAPCTVLVDELDKALGGAHRGGGDSGVSQRVLGAILTEMQESPVDVFWIMTMNRVENMPPEILRKGRLDEVFAVTIPNEEERLDVLRIHLRKRKQDPDTIPDLNLAAERSAGFVPAEIEAAVKEAVTKAFATWKAGKKRGKMQVTGELIAAQLAGMKPLSEAFKEEFNAMQAWAANNARAASKHGAEAPVVDRGAAPAVRQRSRAIAGGNMSADELSG